MRKMVLLSPWDLLPPSAQMCCLVDALVRLLRWSDAPTSDNFLCLVHGYSSCDLGLLQLLCCCIVYGSSSC